MPDIGVRIAIVKTGVEWIVKPRLPLKAASLKVVLRLSLFTPYV